MDFVRQKFLLLRLFVLTCYLALFLPPPSQDARAQINPLKEERHRNKNLVHKNQTEAPGPHDFTPVTEHPSPVTHTSTITGEVYNDIGAPIAGAAVKAVNPDNPEETFETITDSQGKYILPVNFKTFAWKTLQKFDLDISHNGFTTKQNLVEVIANRTAGAGRGILRTLDAAITQIGPPGGVHVNSTGEIRVTIPPGALPEFKAIQTTVYNHSKQLPAPLPGTSFFTYANFLTADGGDVEFLAPATVEVDNSLGFAPNTAIPIGYYNPTTRLWEDSGTKAVVDGSGRWVKFTTTHFSTPDCNFPPSPVDQAPTGPNNGPVINDTTTNNNRDNISSQCGLSKIDRRTGNLFQDYFLPAIKAFNRENSPQFVYNSLTAKPSVLIGTETDLDPRYTTQPDRRSVKFEIEGREASVVFTNAWGKNVERFLWDAKNGQGNWVETGSYPYKITLSNDYPGTYWTADYFGGPPVNDTGVPTREPVPSTTIVTGRVIVNNQVDSVFGSGWNLANQRRLYPDPDGRVLLVEGNGSSSVFELPIEDLAVVNMWYDDTVSILLGKTSGDFQDRINFSVGDWPTSVTVGDFNRDGKDDLVIANSASNDISVLLGNGDGTFQSQRTFPVGWKPEDIDIGDFNQDNKQDLAVVGGWNDIWVLLGDGDGNFDLYQTLMAKPTSLPDSIAVADFDNDGIADLVTENETDDKVQLFFGNDDGTFQPYVEIPVGDAPRDVVAGDFNKDQNSDIAIANYSNSVSILLGNGNGTFQPFKIFEIGSYGFSIAIGDFNNDENEDLVISGFNYNIWVLLGNGDGIFRPFKTLAVGGYSPTDVVVGNFNADEFQDIAVGNWHSASISVLLGKGDTNFQPFKIFRVGNGPDALAVGNFNSNPGILEYESISGNYSKLKKNPDNTFTLTEKEGTVSNFNSKGLLISEIDRNGNTTSHTYNADDQLETITYPGNATDTFVYDPTTKKLQSVTDNAGRTTQFVIDANGDLTQIINPDGTSKSFTYSDHLMLTKTNENNHTTDYVYDKYGRIKETLTPEYDVWNGSQVVRERVKVIYSPSDTKGLINDIPPGQGTPENPAPIIDPLTLTDEISGECGCDVVKAYTNPFGSLTESQDGLGRKTTYTRDPDNNATKITYPNGRTTEMTYDGRGNLLTVKEKFNSAVTTFTYEPTFNQVKTITDPLLNVTTFEYDAKGNLIQIKDDNDTITEMTYLNNGLLESVTQAKGVPGLENTTRFSYDPVTGNLLVTTDPLTNVTTLTYDPAGNLKTILDAEGKLTTYTNDPRNNYLMSVEDHLHNLTEYTYDNVGNLKTVEDARDKTTTFTYNEHNLLSSILNPLGKTKQFTYNADRLLGRILDAKNQQIKFEYDAANQLKFKYLPAGQAGLTEETVSYGYDSGGNLNSIQDSDSKLSFTYDQLNRLTKAQTLTGGVQPVTTQSYTYDKNNNRETWVDVQNKTFYYTFDNLNRFFKVADYRAAQSTVFAQYGYDLISRRSQVIYANGTRNLYDYNLASELTNLTHRTTSNIFASFAYTYNNVNYRKTMTTLEGVHDYVYDDIYRVTAADHPDIGDEAFTYDAVGNRLTKNASPEWVYNDGNRLQDDGTYRYTYDENGNMTQKILKANPNQKAVFTYNSENQLISVQSPVASVQYSYDGLGRRIQKDVNGVKTKYIYDGEDIAAEYDGSNVLQATWLHGPGIDESIRMTRGGQDYYYHSDGLGSITELTNSSGAVIQTYEYDSFGNITAQTGTLVNPFTYTSREFDAESGLMFYRFRYLDPRIGRFMQEDPIWDVNVYPLVYNNPLNLVDPFGLKTYDCKKPLDLFGGKGTKSGPDIPANPFFHEYYCISTEKGTVCYGQTTKSGKLYGEGASSNDKFSEGCKLEENDNECFEKCLEKEGKSSRPPYGVIGPRTNCQEWTQDAFQKCRIECGLK